MNKYDIVEPPALPAVNLHQIIPTLINRAKPKKPVVDEEQVKALRALQVEWDELILALQVDVRAEARRLFGEQQARIGRGEDEKDAWTIPEFMSDIRARCGASKARLRAITAAARKIAVVVNDRLQPLIEAEAARIEKLERAEHAALGVGYVESQLVLVLRDLPARLTKFLPHEDPEAGCAPPRSFIFAITL